MNDQTRMQRRRRFAVIAISAITACTTAACSKNTGIEATNSTAPVAKVLTLGQPSPPQEVTKNGKFTIAPTKVVEENRTTSRNSTTASSTARKLCGSTCAPKTSVAP